ncbi:hypothetical protein [Paenibacillus gallinarum]|uniref:Lipoprotein n=1 Tax=Paenibacillus gallinarum TaxID=2762232 RepID=A0ABR8T5K6_9BACL|nr:hypothetical protein [Paenibacillus gallinarum]MBD7971007.1 hypothetical protein [Paenibacillus gallinarum]
MNNIIKPLLIVLLSAISIIGCSEDMKIWRAQSENWSATFQGDGVYTIRYIGEEENVENISYLLKSDTGLTADGNMEDLGSRNEVKVQVVTDNIISNRSILLTIEWNDKKEELTLE